ncbi:hypothetical protein WH47_06946, partial [Habropoda laboriosa]
PTAVRSGRPASTGVLEHRGDQFRQTCTRRRPGVTAHISATPVGDLSPFGQASQSPLRSCRPSHHGGGTAPELRFSTFLSRTGPVATRASLSPFRPLF